MWFCGATAPDPGNRVRYRSVAERNSLCGSAHRAVSMCRVPRADITMRLPRFADRRKINDMAPRADSTSLRQRKSGGKHRPILWRRTHHQLTCCGQILMMTCPDLQTAVSAPQHSVTWLTILPRRIIAHYSHQQHRRSQVGGIRKTITLRVCAEHRQLHIGEHHPGLHLRGGTTQKRHQ